MAKNIHTVFNSGRGMWENKKEGSPSPVSYHHTKNNALDRAEKIAGKAKVEHFIHGKDGKIQERNSYGNDPFGRYPKNGTPFLKLFNNTRVV